MKKIVFDYVTGLDGKPVTGADGKPQEEAKIVAGLLVSGESRTNTLQKFELAKKLYNGKAGDEMELEDSEIALIREVLNDGRPVVLLAAPILAKLG